MDKVYDERSYCRICCKNVVLKKIRGVGKKSIEVYIVLVKSVPC